MDLAIVTCYNGHPNSSEQVFCGQCGLKLTPTCPNGHATSPGQRFCAECGAGLSGAASPESQPRPTLSSQPDSDPEPASETPTAGRVKRGMEATPDSAPTARNWYNRNSQPVQAILSLGLLLPALVIAGMLPAFLGEPLGTLLAGIICCLYFIAALWLVARTHERRSRAVGLGVASTVLLYLAWIIRDDGPIAIVGGAVTTVGFIAAWGIARRSNAGWKTGFAVSAIVAAVIHSLYYEDNFFGFQLPIIVDSSLWFWQVWPVTVAIGSLVWWCVEAVRARSGS